MEDEREAECGPNGTKDDGSECSAVSDKSAGLSDRADNHSGLVAVNEKVKNLHNGDPDHVSSDEESVVEECRSSKRGANSDEENENVEKESLESEEEEDFKLHLDVDVSSDQGGSDGENVRRKHDEGRSVNVDEEEDEEREVIELSAGEDDDCEVVEIKEKDGKQSDVQQCEATARKGKSSSVEVVDIDGETDEAELAREAREDVEGEEPAVDEDEAEREEEEFVVAEGEVEDDDDDEMGGKSGDETEDAAETRLEERADESRGVLVTEDSGRSDVADKDVDESGAGSVVGDDGEDEPRDSAEACWQSDTSTELPDTDRFLGFSLADICATSKYFQSVDEGEFVGTLHVSPDSYFFSSEGATPGSGSEAGDSGRLSPAPTDSSRCNSPSVSSVSGERRSNRKRFSLDVSNPVYLKPFELGWKRELVYRSSLDSANRRMADVYYYTPNNRKVRSAREVLEFVDGIELTTRNFLFSKEPMGLDSSRETIREAKKTYASREGSASSKESKDEAEVSPPAPKKSQEKQKSQRAVEVAPVPAAPKSPLGPAANSAPAVAVPKAATTPTSARGFPRIKVTPTRTQKEGASTAGKQQQQQQPRPLLPKTQEEPPGDLKVGMLPPPWGSKPAPKKAAVSTTWSSTPKMVSEPLEKKMDPCSIHCPLKMGVIPTLQCRLCLCLYHPECVGLGSFTETIHSYVCKNCQMEIRDGKTSLVPPKQPAGAGPLPCPAPAAPPQVVAPRPPLPGRPAEPGKLVTVPRLVKTREAFVAQGGKQSGGKKILGSVTTWLPSSASVQMSKAAVATGCETVASSPPASMQSVALMNGRKYIVVPKHNVLSVSPSSGDKAPCQPQGAATTSPGKESSVLLGGPPGVLLVPLLPQADKGSALQTQYLIVNAPPGGGIILPAPPLTPDTSSKEQRGRKRAASLDDAQAQGPPAKQLCVEQAGPGRVHSLVQDVCVVYKVLRQVFQYLKVQELLRAARVCHLWRDLAQHPTLWATVHMKNSKVSDWEGLACTLSARRTSHLDLRKMLLPQRNEEVADMWRQFCAVIGRLGCLERLDLCRCPASVVQHVLTACPGLHTLNATAISCNSISLQDAGSLSKLQELRLKSLSGITLETSLSVLSQLSNLKHLALTTFRNLGQQGVDVVGSLEKLELLELGEVNNLSASFPAESLAKLSNLRRLRLEKVQGPDTLTFTYLETARSLPQLTQLELVNFDVKPGFDTMLASCSNIRKLLIIPTYVTQSATTNRMVLGGVLQLSASLQQFVWGVTHELLRVTELFVDQCDVDQVKKEQLKKGDCIPVLKPVPGIAAVHSPSDSWSYEEKYGGPTPSVEILSLPKLHKLLNLQLPHTKVKLLKIPFHATWRQYLSDMHA